MVGASAVHDRCRTPFPFACAAFVLMTQNGMEGRLAGRIDDGISAEAGLFTVAAGFGLGFSGIIPAFWRCVNCSRLPKPRGGFLLCCCSAEEGWLPAAGSPAFFTNHLGYHAPAFALGIGTNIANLLLITVLVGRHRRRAIYA
jgi:hypothetical protein